MNKVLIFCAVLFSPVNYDKQEIIGFPPDQTAKWEKIPNIKVCDLDIPIEKVNAAVYWWQMRGYKFGYTVRSNCLVTNEPGYIYITLPTQSFNFSKNLASTKIARRNNTTTIVWAHIEVIDPHKTRLLEHELGHALGWSHASIDKHIMHPSWQRGGWVDKGLRYNAK